MRAMKDSGIEWIGEIPEDWNVKRVKAVLCERNESNNPIQTDRILSLTNDRGVIPYEEKGDVGNKSKEDLTGYKLAYPGDIVLNSMNVFIGSVALSSYFGCVSPVYYMLYPRNKNDSVSFYNYLFQTKELQTKLHGYGNGIMEIRMRIQMSKLNSVQLPVPPSDVQQKIADYLDRKCSQIDAIIARQQEVIEKLKAYKLSVITEAVTKGLNPHAPMKDSGVEWIGEIPEQWSVVPLTKQLKSIVDYRGKTPEKVDTGVFLVTAKNIKNGKIDYEISTEYVKVEDYEEIMHRGIPQIGDVLFTTEAPLGQVANVDRTDIALAQRIIKFSTNEHLNSYYLKYWIMSIGFQNFLMALSTGSTALGIKASKLFMLPITLPSIKEQQQIVTYLDNKCVSTEAAIMKKSSLIDSLIAYKKSLIYEVVTGKKEV